MPKKTERKDDEILVTSSYLSLDDEHLIKLFDQIETASLDALENAARQIITLSVALLGAFFGLLAFKDTPAYLHFWEVKIIASSALISFLLALFFALRAVLPHRYSLPSINLTANRRALDEMLNRKYTFLYWASWILGVGSFLMLIAALDILFLRI